MSGRLNERVAVVTGGSNGIGRACAIRFAEEGARVVVADIIKEPGEKVVSEIEAQGGEAIFFALDASSPDQNRSLAETAAQRFGGIDVLLTAAGISHGEYRSGDFVADKKLTEELLGMNDSPEKRVIDLDLSDWQKVLDVNLTGTLLAVQSCTPHMLSNGGSIITIASIAAKRPDAGPLAYCVSKAGVWMLTKALAPLLGPSGIRVNAIGPGFIQTNMTKLLEEQPELLPSIGLDLPLGRLGVPRDIANAALFLASDESSYFTGEILHPDGGIVTE